MATDDEYAYINPERTRTLLETPSGFALFDVDDDALKEADVLVEFSFFCTEVSLFPFSFHLDLAIGNKSAHVLSFLFAGYLGVF